MRPLRKVTRVNRLEPSSLLSMWPVRLQKKATLVLKRIWKPGIDRGGPPITDTIPEQIAMTRVATQVETIRNYANEITARSRCIEGLSSVADHASASTRAS
jgi:hypothetical protein